MTTVEQPRATARAVPPSQPTVVERLAEALESAGVPYCQWKGHSKRHRWLTGTGDLDLLVDRAAWPALVEVLIGLGFKRAVPPAWLHLPGVTSYLAYERATGRLVHVHAYHQLVIGLPWRTILTPPLATAVLAGATRGFVVRAPAPHHELLLVVLQAAQRSTLRDMFLPRRAVWIKPVRRELQRLEPRVEWTDLVTTLEEELPSLPARVFENCLDAYLTHAPAWRRYLLGRAVLRGLRPFAHRPSLTAVLTALAWRIARAVGWSPPVEGKGLVGGGRVIALVGGDGAGKTTCATELVGWLGAEIATLRVHLGKPPRSLLTLLAAAALKLGRFHAGLADHLELLWCVCTARDRHRLYRRAWRFAGCGGVVIAERYPIPENYALCGPSDAQGIATGLDTRLARMLRRVETRFYTSMRPADATVVLLLPPELAVRRKTDEPEAYVRARATIVWETDWANVNSGDGAGAHIIDAGRALPEVLSDLKSFVWSLI